MSVVPPPKQADSTSGSTSVSDVLRIYQTWKGSNIFLLQGRFVFGPDVRGLLLTIFLIAAPVTFFCIFVAKKLMDEFSYNLGLSIMVVAIIFTAYVLFLLLLTSGRDPGIIPRNLHPPKPEGYDSGSQGSGKTPQLSLPHFKEVEVNGISMTMNYCYTCMVYRPPRSLHCSICNNCIERFDHHCRLVGQCIGLRNYRSFLMFVFSATLLCIYVFSFCWIYIWKIMDSEDTTLGKAMIKTPTSIVLVVYAFILFWFVGSVSAFNLYLVGTNQTTYENFRYHTDIFAKNMFPEPRVSPSSKEVMRNFKEIFCTSIPPSKNKFRDKVQVERTVGGGSLNTEKATEDIEMGRKAVCGDVGSDHCDGELKEGDLDEVSLEIRTTNVDEGDRV